MGKYKHIVKICFVVKLLVQFLIILKNKKKH